MKAWSFRVLTAMAIAGMASPVAAATIVVTPSDPQGWQSAVWYWDGSSYSNTGTGAFAGITTNFPRSGLGSAEISLADEGVSEADWLYQLDAPSPLADLSTLAFDWYTASTSTTPLYTSPALALLINDSSYVIWEAAYNGGIGGVPQDTWNQSNILNDQFWSYCSGAWSIGTLGQLNTACFNGEGQVTWLSAFMGFGIPGTRFDGAVDNVALGFGTTALAVPTVFNFEPDPVPEPASLLLLSSGLAGAAIRRRWNRRRSTRPARFS